MGSLPGAVYLTSIALRVTETHKLECRNKVAVKREDHIDHRKNILSPNLENCFLFVSEFAVI